MLLSTKVAFDLFSGTPKYYFKKQRSNVKNIQDLNCSPLNLKMHRKHACNQYIYVL